MSAAMILECPTCHARFVLDAARLPPEGRRVRCSVCKEAWIQKPPAEDPAPPPRPRMRHRAAMLFVLLSATGALALGAYALGGRMGTAEAGSGLRSVLSGEAQGLAIVEAVYDYEVAAGGRALVVSAAVRNTGPEALPPPVLAITLLDAQEQPIYRAALPATDAMPLGQGESADYYLRLLYPPQETRTVTVDFDK